MAERVRLLGRSEANSLVGTLLKSYDAHYYLNFKTPVDLLVAAILSAQTKDDVVNALTPRLFAKYKTARDYAKADKSELIDYVKSVSFAGNKAANIINTCRQIAEKYDGRVPDRMDQLVELPGNRQEDGEHDTDKRVRDSRGHTCRYLGDKALAEARPEREHKSRKDREGPHGAGGAQVLAQCGLCAEGAREAVVQGSPDMQQVPC